MNTPENPTRLRIDYPKTLAFFFSLILFIVLVVPTLAQEETPNTPEPLVLTDGQGKYPLGRHLGILEDPAGELTIADVSSPQFAARFKPSREDVPNFGYTDSVIWLRLQLQNQSGLTSVWLLEANFPNLNYVDLYLPTEGEGFIEKKSGALLPFNARDIPYYHLVFNLPLSVQADQTIYIRVKSGSSMTLSFTLWSPNSFAVNKINDMWGIGLFYGALLIMLGYHLFALYSLREINYFYFVLVLAGSILFFATYEGIADLYIWPGLSQHKRILLATSMALFFMSTLKFSDVFLEQKIREPFIHHLINLFIGVWALIIVITPFSSYSFIAELSKYLILLTPVFALIVGVNNWRKGYPEARFYLISWVGYMLGVITLDLVRIGVLPSTPFTEKAYNAGLIWLVLMWSLALANRINQLKKETEEANRELRGSEHRLSQILDGLPIGVVVYAKDQKPRYNNKRSFDILSNPSRGILPDISAGRTLEQAMQYFSFRVAGSDQDYPIEKLPIYRALHGEPASADDIEVDLVDKRVPLEIWATPVKDDQGNIANAVAAFQDISQRKKDEAELEDYRRNLEQLVEQRTAQLNIANEQLQSEINERERLEIMLHLRLEWLSAINLVNQTMARSADFSKIYARIIEIIKRLFNLENTFIAELDESSKHLKILVHSCDSDQHPVLEGSIASLPEDILSNPDINQGNLAAFSKDQFYLDGDPLSEHFKSLPIHSIALKPLRMQDRTIGFLGLEIHEEGRAITEEEITLLDIFSFDIARVIEDTRLFKQNKAQIAAEERNRLARDLHDSVTQVLFSAALVAEVLPRIWRRDQDKAFESLDNLRRLTRGALAEMRTMLLELRPSAMINTPLSELLAQLTEAVTSRSGLPFQLFIEQTPSLPDDVQSAFYRIAQEALNNVVKHAQATHVRVSLRTTPIAPDQDGAALREIMLDISDDGVGFTPEKGQQAHMGLGIMRERAAAIHADLILQSKPGYGTQVILTWRDKTENP